MARLLSINVGLPRDVAWRDQTVHTGIWKTPVQGRRMARRLNIDGDGQGDLAGHGGEQRAVLVYQIESYQFWQKQLRRNDFTYGQFGENLTVDGLSDRDVCIGDRYRIGGALFEVTQPRVTCYRVGIRLNEPQMAALLVAHARPGFYCRVLEEGELQAGDEIIQVSAGPERLSVADINALLYRPSHPPDQLMRALRIAALSPGWKTSLKALLEQEQSGATTIGNAGLTRRAGPPPGWRGFRPLRVARKIRESSNVVSLILEPADGSRLGTALPGQFVVLRLKPAPDLPVLLRSYSLSGEPSAERYRVSIKREANGAAGAYIHDALQAGDVLDVSAARGSFTLRPGDRPVVLLSAGIGITPVLAMLHELAASSAAKPVWWLHGARNRREHPFVQETRTLLAALAHGRSHICYSSPDPEDRPGLDFDARGHLDLKVLQGLGLPHDGEFYICGPAKFMSDLTAGLVGWGIAPSQVHTELFGAEPASTPGIAASSRRSPHVPSAPAGSGPQVSFARSGLSVRWGPSYASVLELAEACDVPVRWSCRTGVCHTCETALVEGAVNYAPDPIDAPGDGNVLICCSQPRGDMWSIFDDPPLGHRCQKYAQIRAHTHQTGDVGTFDLWRFHERRTAAPRGTGMRRVAGIVGVLLVGTVAQASAETTRFAIMRNGEQIGTHIFEVSRAGSETTVKSKLNLEVKVLFVTAYRLQSTGTEKWVDGRLVSLKSNTDRNGTRHAVTVSETSSGMQIQADGKAYQAKADLIPSSLWNPEVLRRKEVLDPQEGEILPMSVTDHGVQQLTIKSRAVKAHHYTLKSKMSQDVWYDEQQRLVQVRIIGSDGSIITYEPL